MSNLDVEDSDLSFDESIEIARGQTPALDAISLIESPLQHSSFVDLDGEPAFGHLSPLAENSGLLDGSKTPESVSLSELFPADRAPLKVNRTYAKRKGILRPKNTEQLFDDIIAKDKEIPLPPISSPSKVAKKQTSTPIGQNSLIDTPEVSSLKWDTPSSLFGMRQQSRYVLSNEIAPSSIYESPLLSGSRHENYGRTRKSSASVLEEKSKRLTYEWIFDQKSNKLARKRSVSE